MVSLMEFGIVFGAGIASGVILSIIVAIKSFSLAKATVKRIVR